MNRNNIIVLGNGFLGSCFGAHGYDVWARDKFSLFVESEINNQYNVHELNARLMDAFDSGIELTIINTIGLSDTRFCEDDANWDHVKKVNGEIPQILSDMCEYYNHKLVHISTGCLYDVRDIPQKETDFIASHCNYVTSKWIGEKACKPERDLIIRPRLLFDSVKPDGRNNLLCKLPEFDSYLYELNTITSCDTIVEAVEALLEAEQVGIFNVGNTGQYSIWQMADSLGLVGENTNAIHQGQLHESQGLYLVNNLMDMSKLEEFYTPRDVIEELKRCNEILNGSFEDRQYEDNVTK